MSRTPSSGRPAQLVKIMVELFREGCSFAEIAKIMGRHRNNVRVSILTWLKNKGF